MDAALEPLGRGRAFLRENRGAMRGLFVPGWGATAALYAAGLPESWQALELPSFRAARGALPAYRRWLQAEIARERAPLAIAGHSMGAALALLAVAERPERVEKLILVSPAGLPLDKPMLASLSTFVGQAASRCYPARELCRMLASTASAPRAALRLARSVHDLDLSAELEQVRASGIPCTVIGCVSDTLTTCGHCSRLAALLGAEYRELDAPDGHIWMITGPERLAAELSA